MLLLVATPAFAQDRAKLEARIDVSQESDSNVFNHERDIESDLLTFITPRLDFEMTGETGYIDVGIGGIYKRYWEFDELNGVDPFAEVRVDRKIAPKLHYTLTGSYRERSSTNDVLTDQLVVSGDEIEQNSILLRGESPRTTVQDVSTGFRYRLSPTQTLNFNVNVGDTAYERLRFDPNRPRFQPDETDRMGFGLSYIRTLSMRDRLVFGLSAQNYSIEGSDPLDPITVVPRTGRDDTVAAFTTSWRRSWTPRWTTDLRAGARYLDPEGGEVAGLMIYSDPNDPNSALLPFDTSPDSSLGFTGSFDLEYRSKMDSFAFGYSRETRPQSGSSGSLDVDRILLTYSRAIGRRFNVSLRARYEDSRSAAETEQVSRISNFACDQLGGRPGEIGTTDHCVTTAESDFDRTDLGYGASFRWRIRSNLTTLVSYDFVKSDVGGRRLGQSYDEHRVKVGFRYDYDIDLF